MPLQFSSDLDFLEVDVRLCHRRAAELTRLPRYVEPRELEWLERKLKSMQEYFDGQEQSS